MLNLFEVISLLNPGIHEINLERLNYPNNDMKLFYHYTILMKMK
jgi:hypothetical protein